MRLQFTTRGGRLAVIDRVERRDPVLPFRGRVEIAGELTPTYWFSDGRSRERKDSIDDFDIPANVVAQLNEEAA